MLLGHGPLGAVKAVEHQFAKERVAHLPLDIEVVLAAAVDQIKLVAPGPSAHVDVLAQFNVTIGAEQEGTAVTPSAQPVRCEPVDPEVTSGTVVAGQGAVAEILQARVVLMRVVGYPACHYPGVIIGREVQELLYLVAPNVTQDASVTVALEEPGWSRIEAGPVRP